MGNFHLTLSALLWYGGTGWECDAPKESRKKRSGGNGNVQRSARRAGVQLRRLCHCMDARYFVTLTVDARRCDRYDVAAITRKLSVWAESARNGPGAVPIGRGGYRMAGMWFITFPAGRWDLPPPLSCTAGVTRRFLMFQST